MQSVYFFYIMKKKNILLFAVGMVVGVLGIVAARKTVSKVENFRLFEEGWYNEDDLKHW